VYIVILIFLLALMWDVSTGRVPNQLVCFGFTASQVWILYTSSPYEAVKALLGGIAILLILFPLFAIGCLGGGDIKLMMLLPSIGSLMDSISVILVAFVVGAIIGVVRLMKSGILISRLRFFKRYISECLVSGKIKKYDCPGLAEQNIAGHQIHFTIPLFVSLMMKLGG